MNRRGTQSNRAPKICRFLGREGSAASQTRVRVSSCKPLPTSESLSGSTTSSFPMSARSSRGGDEEVPRMALRVLRPKSPHSEEWAQYTSNLIFMKILTPKIAFCCDFFEYVRKKQYICSKFVNLLLCDEYYSSFWPAASFHLLGLAPLLSYLAKPRLQDDLWCSSIVIPIALTIALPISKAINMRLSD